MSYNTPKGSIESSWSDIINSTLGQLSSNIDRLIAERSELFRELDEEKAMHRMWLQECEERDAKIKDLESRLAERPVVETPEASKVRAAIDALDASDRRDIFEYEQSVGLTPLYEALEEFAKSKPPQHASILSTLKPKIHFRALLSSGEPVDCSPKRIEWVVGKDVGNHLEVEVELPESISKTRVEVTVTEVFGRHVGEWSNLLQWIESRVVATEEKLSLVEMVQRAALVYARPLQASPAADKSKSDLFFEVQTLKRAIEDERSAHEATRRGFERSESDLEAEIASLKDAEPAAPPARVVYVHQWKEEPALHASSKLHTASGWTCIGTIALSPLRDDQ